MIRIFNSGALLLFVATLIAGPAISYAGIVVGNPGDTFDIYFDGADSFLLRTSPSENYEPDPTLMLTAGETYTFTHSGPMHPFAFLDDSAPIAATSSGVAGSEYVRTVNDTSFLGNVLEGGSMIVYPTGSSMISTLDWTPEAGNYYYTCAVQWHTNMAGRIIVQAASASVPEPTALAMAGFALIGLLALKRRRR